MKKAIYVSVSLLFGLWIGCGKEESSAPAAASPTAQSTPQQSTTSIVITPAAVVPQVINTPAPMQTSTPIPTETPLPTTTSTPSPTPTPIPTEPPPTPTPTPIPTPCPFECSQNGNVVTCACQTVNLYNTFVSASPNGFTEAQCAAYGQSALSVTVDSVAAESGGSFCILGTVNCGPVNFNGPMYFEMWVCGNTMQGNVLSCLPGTLGSCH